MKTVLRGKNVVVTALPFASESVSAGFPSPAEGDTEDNLDLNQHLIAHPAATFFVRVKGSSMIGAGIHNGDILIVDRALTAHNGTVVVAVLNGEFTVKRLCKRGESYLLIPEDQLPKQNAKKPIYITEEDQFEVWGVATYVIHSLAK